MAFKKVEHDKFPDVRWDKVGLEVQGYYVERKEFTNNENEEKIIFVIELTKEVALRDKDGNETKHKVGDRVNVWTRGDYFTALMDKVEIDMEVQFVYTGDGKKKIKGNAAKYIDIKVDEGSKRPSTFKQVSEDAGDVDPEKIPF